MTWFFFRSFKFFLFVIAILSFCCNGLRHGTFFLVCPFSPFDLKFFNASHPGKFSVITTSNVFTSLCILLSLWGSFYKSHNMSISFICISYILLLHIPSYHLLLPSGRAPQCDLHQLSQSFVEFISAVFFFFS